MVRPAPIPAAKAAVTAGSGATAIPAITAEAMAAAAMEGVVTAAAEVTAAAAIEARPPTLCIYRSGCLDSFQCEPTISLELLQNTVFPFASGAPIQYRKASHTRWARRFHDRLFLQRA
jgi:hypothetical protein